MAQLIFRIEIAKYSNDLRSNPQPAVMLRALIDNGLDEDSATDCQTGAKMAADGGVCRLGWTGDAPVKATYRDDLR